MWGAAANLKGCKNKNKGHYRQKLYKLSNRKILDKKLANTSSNRI